MLSVSCHGAPATVVDLILNNHLSKALDQVDNLVECLQGIRADMVAPEKRKTKTPLLVFFLAVFDFSTRSSNFFEAGVLLQRWIFVSGVDVVCGFWC